MSSLQQFRCEICGEVTSPSHWFVIRCSDTELTVFKWNTAAASAPGTRHFCGEAHAGSTSAVGLFRCARHRSRISQNRTETGGNRSRTSGNGCQVPRFPLLRKAWTQSGRGFSGRHNEPERRTQLLHTFVLRCQDDMLAGNRIGISERPYKKASAFTSFR